MSSYILIVIGSGPGGLHCRPKGRCPLVKKFSFIGA